MSASMLRSPESALRHAERLQGVMDAASAALKSASDERARRLEYLAIADEVDAALEGLSEQLFGKIADLLEEHLSAAVQEVLEQPLRLKVEREYSRGSATISFQMQRGEGEYEDILRGMGGSVSNVLSVGLRFFALQTLPEEEHRRFLVLDEQDCWLRPDLVPRLVKIIHAAARQLGFQVLMISHHDVGLFERYADKVIQLSAASGGASARDRNIRPVDSEEDQ